MTRPSTAMRALGVWLTACLVGCAPMPKLSANWYTVVDPETDPARQAETRQDGSTEIPTREVTSLLLAILNQERTVVTLKDIVINPIVDDQGDTVDGLRLTGPDPIAIEPGQMLLIKNDPNYNESWPRAVVPYQRIYGMNEPKAIPPLANDGTLSPHLPEGTPFGLVGTSSLYKRESYPNGVVPKGKVTATYAGGNDPWKGLDAFTSHGNGMPLNWHNQGGDAGLYANDDIHAVRILALEPTTDRNRGPRPGRLFHSHAGERLRVLGEVPVRKFAAGKEPLKLYSIYAPPHHPHGTVHRTHEDAEAAEAAEAH